MDKKNTLSFTIDADNRPFNEQLDSLFSRLKSNVKDATYNVTSFGDFFKDAFEKIITSVKGANSMTQGLKLGLQGLGEGIHSFKDLMGSTAFQVNIFLKALESSVVLVREFLRLSNEAAWALEESLEKNAESIREVTEASARQQQAASDYLKQLSELSKKERLSNVEKLEQIRLIGLLSGKYSDLADAILKAGASQEALNRAMAVKAERDKAERLQALEAERAQLKADRALLDRIISNSGFKIPGTGFIFGGKEDTDKASEKRVALMKRQMEIMKEMHDLQATRPYGDYLRRQQAERLDQKQAQREKTAASAREAQTVKQADLEKRQAEAKQRQADALRTVQSAEHRLEQARKAFADAEHRRNMLAVEDARRREEKITGNQLKHLQRRQANLQRKLGRFGFSLDYDPDESASKARRRKNRRELDASIAEKQALQASGESARYTGSERDRIKAYRRLERKAERTGAEIAQLEAAKSQKQAAEIQKSANSQMLEAARAQRMAAIQIHGASLAMVKARNAGNIAGAQVAAMTKALERISQNTYVVK